MSSATYFVQDCPTCGRRLQVRVEYLGKSLVCVHCRGSFQATDPDVGARPVFESRTMLSRADQLLSDDPSFDVR